MCCGCWKEDGAHQIDNAKVRAIVAQHALTDPFGRLHIVVDDDNIDDESLAWCYEHREDDVIDQEWTEADQAFYDLMMSATFEERVSAVGLIRGCWGVC